ncbi:dioxygenase [Ottowia thiooxydans]|uniref:dioxygenase family protein n=1 Tax=Ottowia thiooxydans TaxID=219182 RepID=UPI0003FD55B7|nr:dioxygenase [Ottowia thiooxydans]
MIDLNSITDEVVGEYDLKDDRANQLVHTLIRYLHGYAREVQLTHAEWRAALSFLTRASQSTNESRNEFSLISDVLGVSSLVDLMASAEGATPGSVLGPFHVHDSKEQANGFDLRGEQAGTPTLFRGRVMSASGQPLQALIDFWQNADNALYPQMDSTQDYHNLRCKLRTDADGTFAFRTVLPQPYGIPEDGPVGDLVRQAGRTCMRPAHFHTIVMADGHLPVTTEIFFDHDPYLETDAVFGVREKLITHVHTVTDSAQASAAGMPCPFSLVEFDFHLAPQAPATR